MANVRLKFYGTEEPFSSLECFAHQGNREIIISIENDGYPPSCMSFDISTAIKLAKTLRTEINKIKEDYNG